MPKINLRDQKVQIGALAVVLGLIGLFVWYQKVYTVKRQISRELEVTYEKKHDRLAAIFAMKPQRNKLKQEIVAKQETLDSLKSIFPDQKEIPKLIREITRLAKLSNVYTTKFVPLEDRVREYYVENRYNLSLWGGYHEFATFLSRLANLKLIINLSTVKIMSHPHLAQYNANIGGGIGPRHTLVANFEMTTFSSKR